MDVCAHSHEINQIRIADLFFVHADVNELTLAM